LKIVEDGACAAGATLSGRPAGSLGDIGCFSFHPRKSVTTGEGGMLTTNDDKLAEKLDMLRNHGASVSEDQRHRGPKPYILPEFDLVGYNYRMTDLQGALGVVQLSKLEKFIEERNKWATYYNEHLKDIPWLRIPVYPNEYKHGWQSYVLFVDEAISPIKRNDLMEHLQQEGISTRPGTHAVHMLGFYKNHFRIQAQDFPGAFAANEYSMSIPLHNRMVQEDYDYIIATLRSIK
jgi:dTDP-4-amino-4,6-dideoxygalactose transaminase